MVDGYEETDWPMQYTQSVWLLLGRGLNVSFGDLNIYRGTSDVLLLFCPNEQYAKSGQNFEGTPKSQKYFATPPIIY